LRIASIVPFYDKIEKRGFQHRPFVDDPSKGPPGPTPDAINLRNSVRAAVLSV